MAHRYTTQTASDVKRNGLGVELLSESGDPVAEIFRSDHDHTLVLNTFSHDVPLEAVELLIARAKERLEPFEDGSSLETAALVAPQLFTAPGKGESR